VSLRKADGTVISGRTIKLADESDLPIAVERLIESLTTDKSIDETLTLDNATKAESNKQRNRIELETVVGMVFGIAAGIGAINSYPVLGFDTRFELNSVMLELNLGLGIRGNASYGDISVIGNYYFLSRSISPYLGFGGGVFFGNKWAEKGDEDSDDFSDFFGGHFFPQIGIEFLRAARIRIHADVRYMVNVSNNRWGHGPLALAGISF
jgi:hypothetical protein